MLRPEDTLIMETEAMETGSPGAGPPAEYLILREIGRGGMSTVYEARDARTGRSVALKMLALPQSQTPEQQRDLIARFRREARAVARLSHPNIVVIHEVGERDGAHFLAMEYLPGPTLRERIAEGPLTPAQALPTLEQIASALDAVHAAGIIHRDVKPSNVLMSPDGSAKLLDFGIARQSEDTTITSTGVLVGSPSYMAPEQVRGEAGTAASDVWALGILLYEMLAGQPPFQAATIPAVLYQVTHEPPPPIPGLPPAVQKALRRALDKNPARRFQSAGAFAGAVRAALPSPAPVRANSPLSVARRLRWAALLPLLLLGIGAGFLVRHHRAPATAVLAPTLPAPVRLAAAPVAALPVTLPHRPAPVNKRPMPPRAAKRPVSKQPAVKHLAPKHPAPKHPALKRRPAPVPRRHRPSAPARRRAAYHARRVIPRYFRRPFRAAPRHSDYDAAAAARLSRFIWNMGQ